MMNLGISSIAHSLFSKLLTNIYPVMAPSVINGSELLSWIIFSDILESWIGWILLFLGICKLGVTSEKKQQMI